LLIKKACFTKKVVALLGSKRRGNTYGLLMQIKKLLAERGAELEIIELYRRDVQDCRGCEACILTGRCAAADDVSQIMDDLSAADGIILASPVYLQQVSGKIKTFFDRTCSWYHRPVLAAKPVLCVATTKGSGLRATLSYLENVAAQLGAVPAGAVGRTIFNIQKPVGEKAIEKFARLINAPQSYSPTLRQLIGFEVQKSLSQHLNGLDAEYWKEKGWTNAPYFYPCRVNPFRRAISGAVGAAMRRGMSKKAPASGAAEPERRGSDK
jgi:multimeric flavodoxin WrbA